MGPRLPSPSFSRPSHPTLTHPAVALAPVLSLTLWLETRATSLHLLGSRSLVHPPYSNACTAAQPRAGVGNPCNLAVALRVPVPCGPSMQLLLLHSPLPSSSGIFQALLGSRTRMLGCSLSTSWPWDLFLLCLLPTALHA